ncbi:unnamed protein product, partial [Oppiella nova]
VVVTGRRADKVSEVAKECLKVSPKQSKALEVVADVTKPEDLRRLVDTTVKHFGKLDVLVNNAGAGTVTSINNKDFYEIYQRIIQINLNSVVYLTHICVEHLEKTKGNVINISSVGGMRPVQGCTPYCMAKCALDMFTKCMAAELGPKRIRVNVINPGPIRTEFMEAMGMPKEMADMATKACENLTVLGRVGESGDVGDSILYLASDHAAFITGTNVIVDGGCVVAYNNNADILKTN